MTIFELARWHYKYAIHATTTVTVTLDANGIKVKNLGNIEEKFQLNEKTICTQVFERAYKLYHWQRRSIIARNIIETFKRANSI